MSPDLTSTDGCRNKLLSNAVRDDRESLSEVATEKDCNTTKWRSVFQKILKSAIYCFDGMLVLHWNLIPDDKSSLAENRKEVRTTCDGARGGFIYGQGDFK